MLDLHLLVAKVGHVQCEEHGPEIQLDAKLDAEVVAPFLLAVGGEVALTDEATDTRAKGAIVVVRVGEVGCLGTGT